MATSILGSAKKQREFQAELDWAIAHHNSPTRETSSPPEREHFSPRPPESAKSSPHADSVSGDSQQTDKYLSPLWKRYEKNHINPKAGEAEKKWNQNIFRHVESKYGLETAKAMYGSAEALRRSGVKAMHAKYGIEEMRKSADQDNFLNELVTVVKNRLPPQDNFIDRTLRNTALKAQKPTELEKKQKAVSKRMLRAKAASFTERGVARGMLHSKSSLLRAASLKGSSTPKTIEPSNVPPVKVPDVKEPKLTTPKSFHTKPIT